jgi:hypothetical protein
MIEPQEDEVEATTGIAIKTSTADAGYAYAKVFLFEGTGLCPMSAQVRLSVEGARQ